VVHELLYEGRPQVVDLKRISRGLLELARRVHAPPDLELECQVEGDQVELGSREGSSLALVINELATNAIRHGFAGRKQGRIWAHLRQADSEVELVMEDDGRGLAPGFDPTQPTGLGLQIVKGLVERELRGRFALERREPGTRARVVVDLARLPWAAPAEGNGADTAG
jgi:two-component sensor histidine kinase